MFKFDSEKLQRQATEHKESYRKGSPFPHAVIDDFFPEHEALQVLSRFPGPDAPFWKIRDKLHQPGKMGAGNARALAGVGDYLSSTFLAFCSYQFVDFLEQLTGIDGLIPDPHLRGGGLHQVISEGRLNIHADFNLHPDLHLYRRVNVLVYFNEHWVSDYGGPLELWDRNMTACVQSIEPVFNRSVIFNTSSTSFHGHPKPWSAPSEITRKSLAFYVYTVEPNIGESEPHATLWQVRPGTKDV